MTWLSIDDRFHDTPEIVAARTRSTDAALLYYTTISWTEQAGTPGYVPVDVPAAFAGGKAKGLRAAAVLVDVGLWQVAEAERGGWVFTHPEWHFFEYRQGRQGTAVRKGAKPGTRGGSPHSEARSAAARARWDKVRSPTPDANSDANLHASEMQTDANLHASEMQTDASACLAGAVAVAPSEQPATPEPEPEPVPDAREGDAHATDASAREGAWVRGGSSTPTARGENPGQGSDSGPSRAARTVPMGPPYSGPAAMDDTARVARVANELLNEHLARCSSRPLPKVVGRLGTELRAVVELNVPSDDIRAGLALLRLRPNIGPALLQNLITEARSPVAFQPAARMTQAERSAAYVTNLRARLGQNPPSPDGPPDLTVVDGEVVDHDPRRTA